MQINIGTNRVFQSAAAGLLVLLCLIVSTKLLAVEAAKETKIETTKPADVRILIDVSGSMKQNDPRNLRRPALDLLIQLLPESSRSGVWTFGRYVNMLVPHANVNAGWRNQAEDSARLINSVALHTNIGLALDKANYDDNAALFPSSGQYNKSVILLTDGVVDIDRDVQVNDTERARILNEILPAYQEAGVAIHAVALSTNADAELLEQLAQQTGGLFAVAEDASDLNKIFLRAFDQAVPAERVPLEDNRFLIDSSIEEFTALVFKQQGSGATRIESPAGELYSVKQAGERVRWYSSEDYDLITIRQPEEGEWKINAEFDPENRVTVVSNLNMDIEPLPLNLYLSEEHTLQVSLTESGEIIENSQFIDLLTVSATLSHNHAEFWQQPLQSESGYFARDLDMLKKTGDHLLKVSVDGKTFKREKVINFTIREPFSVELSGDGEQSQFSLAVTAESAAYQHSGVEVTAKITSPSGDIEQLVMPATAVGEWSYQATEQITGNYDIALQASMAGQSEALEIGQYSLYLQVPGVAEPVIQEPVAEEREAVVVTPIEDEPVTETPPAEPEVVEAEEQAEVAEADSPAESPAEKEADNSNWLIYTALALGNLVMLGLLAFIYRKMTAPDSPADGSEEEVKARESKESEEAIEEDGNAEEDSVEEDNTEADDLQPPEITADAQEEVPVLQEEPDQQPETESLAEEPEPVDLETLLDAEEEDASEEVTQQESAEEELVAETGVEDNTLEEDLDNALSELEQNDIDDDDDDDDDDSDIEIDIDIDADMDAGEDVLAELDDLDEAVEAAVEENGADNDEEVTLDLDGEFDLSTDISDEVKKQSGA